jgi:hypothetical protein
VTEAFAVHCEEILGHLNERFGRETILELLKYHPGEWFVSDVTSERFTGFIRSIEEMRN